MAPRSFSEDGAFNTSGSAGNPQATSVNPASAQGASALRVPYGDPGFNPVKAGPNDPSPWGDRVPYGDPGFTPTFTSYSYPGLPTSSFAEGGAVGDDDDQGQGQGQGPGDGSSDLISQALASVDSALQYGRQKFGLGGDANTAPLQDGSNYKGGHDYANMRQSGDVEDRRDESQLKNTLEAPVMNTVGNAYSLYNRATGFGVNPDDANDPMSQQAGLNDVGSSEGAIPDEQEEGSQQ